MTDTYNKLREMCANTNVDIVFSHKKIQEGCDCMLMLRRDELAGDTDAARCYKWNPVTMDFDDVCQNEAEG